MTVEHVALHIGALCVLTVIVVVAVMITKSELVFGEAASSPKLPKKPK
jgi:hypothetical protein